MPKLCTCGHEVGEHLTLVDNGVKRGWSSCNECGCASFVSAPFASFGPRFVPTVRPADWRVRFDAFRQSLANGPPITEDDIDAATAEVKAARKANRKRKET